MIGGRFSDPDAGWGSNIKADWEAEEHKLRELLVAPKETKTEPQPPPPARSPGTGNTWVPEAELVLKIGAFREDILRINFDGMCLSTLRDVISYLKETL